MLPMGSVGIGIIVHGAARLIQKIAAQGELVALCLPGDRFPHQPDKRFRMTETLYVRPGFPDNTGKRLAWRDALGCTLFPLFTV
jgi:hypothetical protein